MEQVTSWPFERKLEETLNRALPKLGPEAQAQIRAILNPQALAIVAGVLVAWVVSHAFGIGEAVDIIIVVVGVFAIGLAVFEGLDHLYDFAVGAYRAQTERDLDQAADHFSKGVSILGIQAVLAVLFRGAPKTYRGGPKGVQGPKTAVGQTYRPTLRWHKYVPGHGRLRAGEGWTTVWGDIVVSSRGSARTRQLALFHERIHRILTPKLYPLRNFRIRNRTSSYERSSLSRYLEEALAETVSQLRVNGIREFFNGLSFPVREGYVYFLRRGADPQAFSGMGGHGVITELAALIVGGIEIAGIRFDVWIEERTQTLRGSRPEPEE